MTNPAIISAPLQGFTEAPWRRFHAEIFGGVDEYCAPFVRVEKGAIRPKDLRDSTADLQTTAQIICRDASEFRILADALTGCGLTRIDLNLGCPFPPQVKHGRGAGLPANPSVLRGVLAAMSDYKNVEFSVKMRLGVTAPDEWRSVVGMLADAPLRRVAIHPRVASQQYRGELNLEEYAALAAALPHPIVYNGDILTAEDFNRVSALQNPAGIMIGRGLLAQPWLGAEIRSGQKWDSQKRCEGILHMHEAILSYYAERLCGDTQVLVKIKPYWEYLSPSIPAKCAKAIRKAGTMAAYKAAVTALERYI